MLENTSHCHKNDDVAAAHMDYTYIFICTHISILIVCIGCTTRRGVDNERNFVIILFTTLLLVHSSVPRRHTQSL